MKCFFYHINPIFTAFDVICRQDSNKVRKMTITSLHDLIDDMARQPQTTDAGKKVRQNKGVDAIEIYAGLDPLLAELYRQYLEARRQYRSLSSLRGKDDPMADAARDWMDSAESAVQTRMIELRQDRKIRRQAGLVLERQARQEAQEERESRSAASQKYRNHSDLLQTQQRILADAARREGEDGFFMMIYLLWMLRAITDRVTRTLSLAGSFMAVAVIDEGPVFNKAAS